MLLKPSEEAHDTSLDFKETHYMKSIPRGRGKRPWNDSLQEEGGITQKQMRSGFLSLDFYPLIRRRCGIQDRDKRESSTERKKSSPGSQKPPQGGGETFAA